jgi:hypothetical protein
MLPPDNIPELTGIDETGRVFWGRASGPSRA